MNLKVIAYARNGHTDKFGIPRQSREESPIVTRIVFEPEYAVPEALRGIEGYSHLWLIWGFSECMGEKEASPKEGLSWSPTVRPPRLGGNKRMGVFATRSPFRPNPIGLSSVRLIKVQKDKVQGSQAGTREGRLELIVSGADLMDGTPIYDIKPYLSFSDSHPEAKNGFADDAKDYHLEVVSLPSLSCCSGEYPLFASCDIDKDIEKDILYILSQDPRPGYQDDPQREYKLDYAGYCVTFVVEDTRVIVKNISKI
ncbi:MAG: tRNA (N6-threonylcarbamoyladenosine(37)-N6)-methyltransferase TrmO [Paludibacteraceae bacterium]|nr:tRNA (N6-threonylcarbamoyladenosine(37)-N6)-methyltransferase TrmO [Paludibacteraceae bacterium]